MRPIHKINFRNIFHHLFVSHTILFPYFGAVDIMFESHGSVEMSVYFLTILI